MLCNTNVSVTPTLRGEGQSELTGDITLTCVGGPNLAPNTLIPQVNIQIFLNTSVTSRFLPSTVDNVSEALLLIDEPGSGLASSVPNFGPAAAQKLCPTPTTGCTEYATNINSTLVATDTIGGTTQGRNAFQGIVSGNSVTFFGIPVLPPVTTGARRVFRITNIRANASSIGGGSIIASMSISGAISMLVSNPTPVVGFVQSGLTTSVSGATPLDQCTSQTRVAVSTLSFTEDFGTAFKTRVAAQTNTPHAGQIASLQNAPGTIYNSESGLTLNVGPSQTAGRADSGTRLKAQFSNVPAGLRLYVSASNVLSATTPVPTPAITGGSTANAGPTPYAQLIPDEAAPDGDTSGAFIIVPATTNAPGTNGSVPVVEIPILNGSGVAIWEIVNTNPNAQETITFAVYATYTSNVSINLPPPGIGTVNLSFAPTGSTSSIPRSIPDSNAARNILAVNPCNTPLSITAPLSPDSVSAGSPTTSVTINGTNFTPTSVAQWTAGAVTTPLQTTFVSTTRLTAAVPASLLISALTATITVNQPGIGTSNGAQFTVLFPTLGISVSGSAGEPQGRSGLGLFIDINNRTAATVSASLLFTLSPGLTALTQGNWTCGGNACSTTATVLPGQNHYSSPLLNILVNAPPSVTVQLVASATGFANATTSSTIPITVAPSALGCTTNISVTPTLRSEGNTEQVGDITLSCSGETPLAAGAAIPTTNITVALNTAVTSRLLPVNGGPSIAEALLLIDEPQSGLPFDRSIFPPGVAYGAGAPQTVCPTPLQGCTEYAAVVTSVGSQVPGGQIAVATNSPTPVGQIPVPGYNVFQGVVNGNSVTFFGIPVLPPVPAAIRRVFRITNLRADAASISSSPNVVPVTATISTTGAAPLSLSNPTPTVGFVQPGVTATATPAISLAQCSNVTRSSVSILSFAENFGTAFKTRIAAQSDSLYAAQAATPNQNVPGLIYNSESGLTLSVGSGRTAGLADFGTRLKAQFSNIPAGVRLFVSVNNVLNNGLPVAPPVVIGAQAGNVGTATGFAQLVPTETAAFNAVASTDLAPGNNGTVPVVEIPVVNGSATAVWEVINTNPNSLETLRFAVYATYSASVASGAASVSLSFAPTGSASGTPVPRFAASTQTFTLLSATACIPSAPALVSPTDSASGLALTTPLVWNPTSRVTSYDVYLGTSPSPPLVQNTTATSFSPGPLAGGTTYYWRIVSKEEGGDATSPIRSFTTVATCSYSLNPAAGTAPAAGGPGGFAMATGSGCQWSATPSDSWISINSGGGPGGGTVSYTVAPNPGANARTGTITAGGQSYTITQFGSSCSFVVSPSLIPHSSAAGTATIHIDASDSTCSWTASGLGATPAVGTGGATVTVTIPANITTASRTLTATIAGQTVTVNQAGTNCPVALSSNSAPFSAAGGNSSLGVSVPPGCSYSTAPGPTWITITSGGSGTQSGNLFYTVAPNSTTAPRAGTLSIGGQPFQVSQDAAACSISLDASASGSPFGAAGEPGLIAISSSGTGCTYNLTSNPPWASNVTMPSFGVAFTVDSNPSASPRSGVFVVSGQSVSITQFGTACSYSLRSSSGSIPAAGGASSTGVIAPSACSWTASSNAPWLIITSSGLTGTADVQFTAIANIASAPRTGILTIAGQTYTITQAGALCTFLLSSGSSGTIPAAGISTPATFNFASAAPGCSATAMSFADWITVSTSSGGGSSGTVSYSVAANPFGSARTGSIQVGDQVFTVLQAAAACSFTLNLPGAIYDRSGGSGSIVAAQLGAGCTPGVDNSRPEMVQPGAVTGPAAGAWTLPYAVVPFDSTLGDTRRATLTFGGQRFKVKQTSW